MKHLLGPTIQIDPTFPYYLNRSEDSIADELLLAGYRVARYFVVDESSVNGKLVDALHRRGIAVWATALGNGVYSTAHLPKDWPDWQMTLLKPVQDGYWRLSPFSFKYVSWKKTALASLVQRYRFDGLEIAEPYFPEWNGLSSGVYGDIGPYARLAFKKQTGRDMPDFKHKSSPLYYKNDDELYRLWIGFRTEAVNRFLNELINGPGGVRDARPDIRIATWSIAVDAGPDSIALTKEFQGIDAPSMIAAVKPDVHFIQTNWPDWMKTRLPPDYIRSYSRFFAQIRAAFPELPIGIQTDIGSKKNMRRSSDWLNQFAETARSLGYATWTAYEYHIGKYMYDEKPVPLQGKRLDACRIELSFNKRIDPATASDTGNYTVSEAETGSDVPLHPAEAVVDGNRVRLRFAELPAGKLQIAVSGIRDTPDLWLFPGSSANVSPPGCTITVGPSNHFLRAGN